MSRFTLHASRRRSEGRKSWFHDYGLRPCDLRTFGPSDLRTRGGSRVDGMDWRSESRSGGAGRAATLGFDYPWLEQFLRRASGFHFSEEQAERIVGLVEDKLRDLFAVAEDTALANGRMIVMPHDLPLTKGLRATLREHEVLSREIEMTPALRFLAESGLTRATTSN